MSKKTITGWSIAVTWSDGKKENILDIPDEVAQYIDDYLTEIEEHGDLAKPSTEFVRDKSLWKELNTTTWPTISCGSIQRSRGRTWPAVKSFLKASSAKLQAPSTKRQA